MTRFGIDFPCGRVRILRQSLYPMVRFQQQGVFLSTISNSSWIPGANSAHTGRPYPIESEMPVGKIAIPNFLRLGTAKDMNGLACLTNFDRWYEILCYEAPDGNEIINFDEYIGSSKGFISHIFSRAVRTSVCYLVVEYNLNVILLIYISNRWHKILMTSTMPTVKSDEERKWLFLKNSNDVRQGSTWCISVRHIKYNFYLWLQIWDDQISYESHKYQGAIRSSNHW